MAQFSASSLTAFLMGAIMGVLGFLPMIAAVEAIRRFHVKPTIGKGLVAVGVSFVFLLASGRLAWKFLPGSFLWVVAGAMAGFFAMWAVLAVRARRRR